MADENGDDATMSPEVLGLCEAIGIMAQELVKRGLPAGALVAGWRRVAKGHARKGRTKTAGVLEILALRLELPDRPPEGRA